jgi:putative membrane protein insertion efficiency factor
MSPAFRPVQIIGQFPQRLLILLVRGYRLLLSPWLGSGCRFEPTCSQYALTALQRHGAAAGSLLTTTRLLRCHPWCAGGHDPVPERLPRGLFTRFVRPAAEDCSRTRHLP